MLKALVCIAGPVLMIWESNLLGVVDDDERDLWTDTKTIDWLHETGWLVSQGSQNLTHEGLRAILDGNFAGEDVRFDLDPVYPSPSESRDNFLKDLQTLVLQADGRAAQRPLSVDSLEPWHKQRLAEVALCFFELGRGRRIASILPQELIGLTADVVRAICNHSLKAPLQFDEKNSRQLQETLRGAGGLNARETDDLADMIAFHTQFTSIRPMVLLSQMRGSGPACGFCRPWSICSARSSPKAMARIEQDIVPAGGYASPLMNWIALCRAA